MRFAKARDCNDQYAETIKTIAVCAGSGIIGLILFSTNITLGGSVFNSVNADLFVTGEMGHHQVLELCDRYNAHVLLTEHSNCERGYLREVFVPLLKERLEQSSENSFDVLFSEVDVRDPLSII